MRNPLVKYYSIIFLVCLCSCSSNENDNVEDSLLMNAIEGHFVLESQQDVNDFGELNYESINGSIVIGNNNSMSNITSLEPLSNVKAIFGFLAIQNNPQLTSLYGLENLQFMCFEEPSSIAISNNATLTEISALGNIDYCQSMGLTITNNNNLTNIDAFSNMTTLAQITLNGNDQLLDLSPFNSLESVENLTLVDGNFSNMNFNNLNSCDRLHISSCNNLTNVNSLSNLTSLRVLEIGLPSAYLQYTNDPSMSNQSLKSLQGLSNVTNIEAIGIGGGSSELTTLPIFNGEIRSIALHNTALNNLDGFSEGISEYNTDLYIYGNYNLQNVDGLLNYNVLGEVYLVNNSSLNNIDGFDNVTEITNGYILIDGNNIEQTNNVFESLATIDFYDINISNNSGFNNFSGFNTLSTENLNVGFYNNSDLENINAFNYLDKVNLIVYNNPSLTSLNGFQNVTEGNLGIGRIDEPNSHQPIDTINIFDDSVLINNLGLFNTNLTNLNSFQNFGLGELVQIHHNNLLTDFCGISNQIITSTTDTMSYSADNNAYNPSRYDISNGNCSN